MDFFQLTMRILSAFLMLYFLLIMLRIIFSWIQSNSPNVLRIKQFIHRTTDPYMRHFQGISWLRFGMLDFSPVLGLGILSFLLYITQNLSAGRFPGVGELLLWLISMIWGIAAFFIMIIAITMLVRLVTLFTVKNRRPQWLDRLDAFLFPKVSRIMGFFTAKTVPYPTALGISAAALLIIRFGLEYLLRQFLFPLLLNI
ncbi:MAG: hypothetical protein CSA76_04955 [Spirochaetales bacterium]|nr:MAG: hypothetical protein CSA76_04955 [Spirochaetales bacterium]